MQFGGFSLTGPDGISVQKLQACMRLKRPGIPQGFADISRAQNKGKTSEISGIFTSTPERQAA